MVADQAHRAPDNLRTKEEWEEIWPRIRVFLPLLLVVHVSAPPPIPQLKVPSALQMMRGRYTAMLPIDRKLLETARDIRATQAGIRPENFRELNVAVAACESMVA